MKRLLAWFSSVMSVIGAAWIFTGCCNNAETQIQKAAKDWCMTIRGCQVIPVYPLTEDVQPGDIFLVQVPIDNQQLQYDKNGFLPLDNLLARINPNGYSNFYGNSFLHTNESAVLPHDWTCPPYTNWEPAPHAAFPSYSFSVKSGQGLNLAVPVDGVPVGLGLMNADSAEGNVNIKSARTIGVDTISLWTQVQSWAEIPTNKLFLKQFRSTGRETNYVRVITRVYACGEMNVSLRNASSRSGGLDVGAARPVDLLFAQPSTNAEAKVLEQYSNALNVLQNSLPGGSLRIAAASSRAIVLNESFVPPLIIGYLGFDCEIMSDGSLGPPIPTHAHLKKGSRVRGGQYLAPMSPPDLDVISNMTYTIGELKKNDDKAGAKAILAKLGITAREGEDPFELLQGQVREAVVNRSKLPALNTAFGL